MGDFGMASHETSETSPAAASLWKGTDYGWWLAADTFTSMASSVVSFVIPIIVLAVSGSAALASSVDAMEIAVLCVLGLAGGVIQDRCDRKKLMLVENAAEVVMYALAAAVLIASDALHDSALLWLLVPILILDAVRGGLLGNTSNAMLRGIVPDEQLPKAMSLNDGRDAVVDMVGGPVGGVLMSISRAVPFLAGACCGLISLLATSHITRYWHRAACPNPDGSDARADEARDEPNTDDETQAESGEANEPRPTWRDAFGGLRWLLGDAFQRRLTIAAALITGTSNAFLTITTLEVSEGGRQAVSAGFVSAAVSCGMLVGAVIASTTVEHIRGGVLVVLSFVLLAVGFVGAALCPSVIGRAVFLVLSVLFLPAGNAVLGGLGNVLVAKDKLGRVGAGNMLTQYGSYGLCVLLAGIGMQCIGYATTCWILAAAIAIAAAYALSMRALITIPTPGHWAEHVQRWNISRYE